MAGYAFDLTGRVALVTGASSGLGNRFARLLAASGARVVAGARRTELLELLRHDIERDGGTMLAVPLDVSDEASVIAAYDAAASVFGPVDTVVANAGINLPGSALGLAMDDFDRMVDVNLRGVFTTVREGARRMVAAGSVDSERGRIVIVSSITGDRPSPGVATYCATKAAVSQLGRALALDWAGKGIGVNTISPGYIETELNEALWTTTAGHTLRDGFPRKRVMAPDALDAVMLYLCSDASRQTHGSVFTIDDGQSL